MYADQSMTYIHQHKCLIVPPQWCIFHLNTLMFVLQEYHLDGTFNLAHFWKYNSTFSPLCNFIPNTIYRI
jgi:hypothetical protein